MAMYNRGEAFLNLSDPDRIANLQEAIHCFEEVIPVWEAHGITDDAEDARRNLALARTELAELTAETDRSVGQP